VSPIPAKGPYRIDERVIFSHDGRILEGTINSITMMGEETRLEIKVSRTRFVRISASQIIPEY